MSIDSISLGSRDMSGLVFGSVSFEPCSAGRPSITYNGSLFAAIEPVPRTRTWMPTPGVRERRAVGRIPDGAGNRARLAVAPAEGLAGIADEQNLARRVDGLRDARALQQRIQRRPDADRVKLYGHRPVERHDAARERDAHTGLPGDAGSPARMSRSYQRSRSAMTRPSGASSNRSVPLVQPM